MTSLSKQHSHLREVKYNRMPSEDPQQEKKSQDGMLFGGALTVLRAGGKITRKGWNGKGMFIYLVPAASYAAQTEVAKKTFGEEVPYKAYIAFKTVSGTVVPWVASQTDLLANDWQVAVEKKLPICPDCGNNTIVAFFPPRKGIVGTEEGYRTIGTPEYVDWERAHISCAADNNCKINIRLLDLS